MQVLCNKVQKTINLLQHKGSNVGTKTTPNVIETCLSASRPNQTEQFSPIFTAQ